MFYLNNIINLYFYFILFYFCLFSLLPFGSRFEFSKPRELGRDRFDLDFEWFDKAWAQFYFTSET